MSQEPKQKKPGTPEPQDVSSISTVNMPDPSRLKEWAPKLSDAEFQACQVYIRELLRFNQKLNLISSGTVAQVDAVHVLDSIRAWDLIAPKVPVGSTVLDFGSGNGLPGLLAAALAPNRNFRLIDRDQRKIEFCKHVASSMKLTNVTFSCMDIAQVEKSTVKFAISRGFASVTKSMLLTRPIFTVGGQFFMMKGEGWSLELAELPPRMFSVWKSEMLGQYKIPGTPAEFVVLQCTKITD